MKTLAINEFHKNLIDRLAQHSFNLKFAISVSVGASEITERDFSVGVGYSYFGIDGLPLVFEARVWEQLVDVNQTHLQALTHRFYIESLYEFKFRGDPEGLFRYASVSMLGRKVLKLDLPVSEGFSPAGYAQHLAAVIAAQPWDRFAELLVPMSRAQGFEIGFVQPYLPGDSAHLASYLNAVPAPYRQSPKAWYYTE